MDDYLIYLILSLYFVSAILWVRAIVDLNRSRVYDSSTRLLWLMLVVFLPIVGSLLYFQVRKRQGMTRPRKFRSLV